MKVVYNGDYGGFSLSKEQLDRYVGLTGNVEARDWGINRSDPILVQVVEEIPKIPLMIEDVPKGKVFRIDEYDGNERIVYLEDHDWMVAT